jgi:voltage-gated potassium channel
MQKTYRDEIGNILFFFGIALLVVLAGIVGYMHVEGWNFLDSLYMTLITITTVGFGEVHPLTGPGKIFTLILIVGGMAAVSVWLGAVTSIVIHREIRPFFWRRKMEKEIASTENHIIICGAGETARIALQEFQKANEKIVIIDKDAGALGDLAENTRYVLVLEGDATKDETLQQANIRKAKGLITTLPTDAENLFVVISARALNPKIRIVARAIESHTHDKLLQVGADYVISPKILEGLRMASVLLRPAVVSFLVVPLNALSIGIFLNWVSFALPFVFTVFYVFEPVHFRKFYSRLACLSLFWFLFDYLTFEILFFL